MYPFRSSDEYSKPCNTVDSVATTSDKLLQEDLSQNSEPQFRRTPTKLFPVILFRCFRALQSHLAIYLPGAESLNRKSSRVEFPVPQGLGKTLFRPDSSSFLISEYTSLDQKEIGIGSGHGDTVRVDCR
jgi:hypothetical protein